MFEASGAVLKQDFSCEKCNIDREFCERYLRGEFKVKPKERKLQPLISIKNEMDEMD
jgi:hypothetical protein